MTESVVSWAPAKSANTGRRGIMTEIISLAEMLVER